MQAATIQTSCDLQRSRSECASTQSGLDPCRFYLFKRRTCDNSNLHYSQQHYIHLNQRPTKHPMQTANAQSDPGPG